MNQLMTTQNTAMTAVNTFTPALFDRWVSYVDAGSQKTLETYTKNIRQFARYMESHGVTQPQREDVIAFRDSLKADHKSTTIQGYLTSVKLFFSWLSSEGLYPDVAQHVKAPKTDRSHKKDFLTSRQINKVLSGICREDLQGLRDYAMISLMVTTGLRTISVVNADVSDLRPVGDSMGLFYQGKGHTQKDTYVKIAEPVEDAIREYLSARGQLDSDAPLFASISDRNHGGRMTTRSVSRIAKESLKGAGFNEKTKTAHSFRHSCATLALMAGAELTQVQQMLDHQNIQTTMIYAHALDRAKNNTELKVASAIFG